MLKIILSVKKLFQTAQNEGVLDTPIKVIFSNNCDKVKRLLTILKKSIRAID